MSSGWGLSWDQHWSGGAVVLNEETSPSSVSSFWNFVEPLGGSIVSNMES